MFVLDELKAIAPHFIENCMYLVYVLRVHLIQRRLGAHTDTSQRNEINFYPSGGI